MDVLITLLNQPDGDVQLGTDPITGRNDRYNIVGSQAHVLKVAGQLNGILDKLGYDMSRTGVAALRVKLDKYVAGKTNPKNAAKLFLFETARWSQEVRIISAKKHAVDTTLRIYDTAVERLTLYKELLPMWQKTPHQLPRRDLSVKQPLQIQKEAMPGDLSKLLDETKMLFKPGLRPNVMRDIISDVSVGSGPIQSKICKVMVKDQKELDNMEAALNMILAHILAPSDSTYVRDTSVMLEKLRGSYQKYYSGVGLSENKTKFYSIHTLRWKIGESIPKHGHVKDPMYRVYSKDVDAMNMFIAYMTRPGAKKLTSQVLQDKLPLKGKSISEDKLPLPSDITIPQEEKKIGWAQIRMLVWLNESKRLKEWGVESYFDADRGRCFACLKPVTVLDFEAAHIVPRCKGGKDEITNLHVSCKTCNHGTGGMHQEHAYEWLIHNNMPGLAIIPRANREMLISELLVREQLLLKALSESDLAQGRGKLKGDVTSKLKPTAPIEHRLDTTWALFKQILPKLNDITRGVMPTKSVDGSGCSIM
jgi:hypothetical protein